MPYLIGEIIVYLLIAAVFGFFIGWLIKRAYSRRKITKLTRVWTNKLSNKEQELNTALQLIEADKKKIRSLERQLKKANQALVECQSRVRRFDERLKKPLVMKEIRYQKRDREVDDLKRIRGVGPVFEKLLHSMGIYSLRQIAAFKKSQVDEVAERIGSFRKRILWDNWVEQAGKLLQGVEK